MMAVVFEHLFAKFQHKFHSCKYTLMLGHNISWTNVMIRKFLIPLKCVERYDIDLWQLECLERYDVCYVTMSWTNVMIHKCCERYDILFDNPYVCFQLYDVYCSNRFNISILHPNITHQLDAEILFSWFQYIAMCFSRVCLFNIEFTESHQLYNN